MSYQHLELDLKQVKKMLKNHNSSIKNINSQRLAVFEELHTIEEYLNSLRNMQSNCEETKSSAKQDIDNEYESFIKLQECQYKEKIELHKTIIDNLNREEASLDRICTAFFRVINICPIGYRITFELCYKEGNEKIHTWLSMATEIGKSKTYVAQAIDTTISLVKFLYDLDVSTADLIKIRDDDLYKALENDNVELLNLCEKY